MGVEEEAVVEDTGTVSKDESSADSAKPNQDGTVKGEEPSVKSSKKDDPVKVEDTETKSNGADHHEPSELEAKIIRQVEYYFGDCNLVTDKFMRQQITLDDGWIPLETMVKFNRLKNLSEEHEVIVKAMKKSTNNMVEISEDGEKVRRNPEKPVPEAGTTPFEEIKARSVYLKGFPQDSTLDELMEFFEGKGKVLKIHMRKKYNSKNFKGSIFATFGSKEEAEEFANIGVLKFRNRDLMMERSVDYHVRKGKELQKRKAEREQKQKDRKRKAEESGDKDDETKEEDEEVGESVIDVKGAVLKLSTLPPKTSWEDIREVFQTHGEIAFVDFSRGQEEGYVRFEKEGNAQKALDAAQTKESDPKTVTILEKEVQMQIVEGDDEIQYWKKLKKQKDDLRRRSKNMRNSRGRGSWGNRGRGGGGYKGKRRNNDRGDNSEPSKKVARAE